MNTCSVDDCDDIVLARGWCTRHYYRWRSSGDPLKVRSRWDGHQPIETVCEVDDCGKRADGRWCPQHKQRFYRHGDTSIVKPRGGHNAKTLDAKLWPRVDRAAPDECWLWTGPVNEWGYGHIAYNGGQVGVHRAAYYLNNGEWPEPVCRHTCDVAACCNPAHLVAGTVADNNRDARERSRDRHPSGKDHGTYTKPESRRRGQLNGSAKLTDSQVREIRALWEAGGLRKQDIAKQYGVSEGCVYRVISRRGWSHVE